MSIHYDPEERGHQRITCPACGYHGWSDDCGNCPTCEDIPEAAEGFNDEDPDDLPDDEGGA